MMDKTFEEALGELDTIVADMESGNLSLDDSLKKYEKGIKLARFCKAKLDKAEKKIEILVKNADGSVDLEPFGDEENTPEPASRASCSSQGETPQYPDKREVPADKQPNDMPSSNAEEPLADINTEIDRSRRVIVSEEPENIPLKHQTINNKQDEPVKKKTTGLLSDSGTEDLLF
ncbi:MAG: exodeoxyribonuclease VII small subunit [Candidatus Auribacter fodinae]|uniref:Exodeoxyribonuclease 7 small subunit n=1 Tax=Candidatus Auribacter fodinae TaxID=2093366 RepID=A0A3A4R2L1_9BACT|nr:MAG: exodeoxyribonuclease VII small subunit [Candidatus Auribacter fodinae]